MPALILSFPAGRYHATPFGSHVNEGIVEWPPSPWRLLRALVATGYTKLGWTEVPETGRSLVLKLASVLPRFGLPPAVAAHSRHYMPLGVLDKGRERTTLVIDAWARVSRGEVVVVWDAELTEPEESLLQELVAKIGYLGRSESWLEGRVVDGKDVRADVVPHGAGEPHRPGWEQVSILAPIPSSDYMAWREREVARVLALFPLPEGKKKPSKKLLDQRSKAETQYPSHLLDCLQVDTTWLKKHGWSQPPGSQRVLYWRPAAALTIGAPRAVMAHSGKSIDAALLALATPSRNTHELPLVIRTLPQAELLHRALASHIGRRGVENGGRELLGIDEDNKPLKGHRHVHILPLDLDGDAHLDHILVWAPDGLSSATQAALRAVRNTHSKGIAELRVSVAFTGSLQELQRFGSSVGSTLGRLVAEAATFRSITPFVLPRYLKRHGRNTFEEQIRAELESRGRPAARVEVVPVQHRDRRTKQFRHFVTVRDPRRKGAPSLPPPSPAGHDVRLHFSEPEPGPLALGYGSHFGLGLFEAVEAEN